MTVPAGWTRREKSLSRDFVFKTFGQAIGFMAEVALFCERTDHHPEWCNTYRTISVTLTTHDAGGVTEKDLALATHMNGIFATRGRGKALQND